jgi:uncharacterized protein
LHLENLTTIKCIHCSAEISAKARYCPKCGKSQLTDDHKNVRSEINKFFIAFAVIAAYILSLYLIKFDGTSVNNILIDAIFISIVIVLAFFFWKDIKETLKFHSFSFGKLSMYLGLQAILTGLVYLLLLLIQNITEIKNPNILDSYSDSAYPFLIAFISIAVLPPLTEELGFRAILFNQLLKLTSGTSTVVVTGILFGLLHFSVISFIWLIPAGFFFGWVRLRENTIWYGVCCHFLHNFAMIMISYYTI